MCWPLEYTKIKYKYAKVKCKYANRKPRPPILCYISRHLRIIRKSSKIQKVCPWNWRSRSRRKPVIRFYSAWHFFRIFATLAAAYVYANVNAGEYYQASLGRLLVFTRGIALRHLSFYYLMLHVLFYCEWTSEEINFQYLRNSRYPVNIAAWSVITLFSIITTH